MTINDLILSSPRLECTFLDNATDARSDATIFVSYGERGARVVVVDGGLATARCYNALLSLRKQWLSSLGEEADAEMKLRVTLVVTHCHTDHVDELSANVIPGKRFEIDALYLPQESALESTGAYARDRNGDVTRRPQLLNAMARYAPDAPIDLLPFGSTASIELPSGRIDLYAPLTDMGSAQGQAYINSVYYPDDTKKRDQDGPLAVINSNSLWVHATLNGRGILLTGDTMKKRSRDDEPLDRMADAYGALVRADVVKYPHHGISRLPAAPRVANDLLKEGGTVVLTAPGARAQTGGALDALNTRYVTTEDGPVTFVIEGDAISRAE